MAPKLPRVRILGALRGVLWRARISPIRDRGFTLSREFLRTIFVNRFALSVALQR